MDVELTIANGKKLYIPCVQEGVTWQTDRKGAPGELRFNVVDDGITKFEEGNAVSLRVDGKKVFFGFIFTKKRNKEGITSVTAFDQLRYFKNKDTIVYENKTASEFIKMIAKMFNLKTGKLDDTKFKIASRIEENTTLFDMVQNALDLTLQNKKKMYVLYDNFGKLRLKDISSFKVKIVVDEETGENFDYTSTIDSNTYNQIKLTFDNKKTGKRDIYMAKSSKNINKWGVLQYFDTLHEGENGKAKANALLELYNKKTRNLSISKVIGDLRVRAGCMVVVQLKLDDIKLSNYMLVEKCKHIFLGNEHFMDLTLRGGEFIA